VLPADEQLEPILARVAGARDVDRVIVKRAVGARAR
jgi:hypothetical protein